MTASSPEPLHMYGTAWCPDCQRAKQFLSEQRVDYRYTDVDADEEGRSVVESLNNGKLIIPVLLFGDGSTLVEPSNAELAAKLGLQTHARQEFYDLIVIGSGIAGLTSATYAAREGIPTLVIERAGIGGSVGMTDRLDNFPGFPEGVSGAEFADRLRRQAERFGVEILSATEVTDLGQASDQHMVTTNTGSQYRCHALLYAAGSTYRRLDVPGEEDYIGSGVHFCATCDGAFYRDQHVVVVGGGNSAAEESLFLTTLGQHVTLVTNGDSLTASRTVSEKVLDHPAIEVRTGTVVRQFEGRDGKLTRVHLESVGSGEQSSLDVPAAFVFIGLSPNVDILPSGVDLDPQGFVVSDAGMQTTLPGVFVAGDVRSGSTKQAASAAGEGAAAALAIRRYLEPFGSTMRPNVVDSGVAEPLAAAG